METGSSRERSSGRSVKKGRGNRSRPRSSSCDSDAPSTKKRKKSSNKHKKVRSGTESRSTSRKKKQKHASERHKTKKHESVSKFSDEKRRKKSRRSPSSSDGSESDDSGSSGVSTDSEEEKRLKRKRKRRTEKDKKKKKKRKSGTSAETSLKQVVTDSIPASASRPIGSKTVGLTADVKGKEGKQQRGPMTKEEWERQQSIVRRVYDPDTGRHRLVKGGGEIIEEIVSKERQKAINKQATVGDGMSFQQGLRKLL